MNPHIHDLQYFALFAWNMSIVVTTYFLEKSPCGAEGEEKRDLASSQELECFNYTKICEVNQVWMAYILL